MFYDSQAPSTAMTGKTGNWWFPYDIYVVPQPNGDLHFFGPRAYGEVYQWDAVSQAFTSPPGFFDRMVANGNGTWTRTTRNGDVWQFNAGGHLVSVTSRYGLSAQFNRNAQQAITSIVDYAGRAVQVTYNPQGYISSLTDWGGRTVSFTYTTQGYLASITRPATTFYDRATGQIVTRAKTETFTYVTGTGTANDGNLLTKTDDRGQQALSVAYDTADRAVAVTQRGRTWNHTYNPSTTTVVDPDGITVVYSFGPTGAIVRKEVFTKTGLGQDPLREGEPDSYVWLYERNSSCGCDLITKITSPDGSTRSFTYDAWGNRLSETTDPAPGAGGDQVKRTWTFAPFSQYCRMVTYTTPNGYAPGASASDFTYTWTYDQQGSVIQQSSPKASVNGSLQHPVLTYTRNGVGLMLSRTTPTGKATTYEYAPTTYNLAKATVDPSGLALEVTYGHDTYDRMIAVTNPRGHGTTYQYNALDLMTEARGPQPKAPKITRLYDNNDNLYRIEYENKDGEGDIDQANPWFTTYYNYDANNRLASVVEEIDGSTTRTTSYTFTPGGRMSRITDPNGNKTDFEYDERGLLFKMTEGATSSVAGTATHNYSLNGDLSSVIDPRGITTTLLHDHAGRLTKVTHPNGRVDEITYDRASNVTKLESKNATGTVVQRATSVYDPYGLLTSSSAHHLDSNGNTTQTDTTATTYDADLQLVSVTNPLNNSVTYTYDLVGRLTTVQDPVTNKVDYVYDGNGNVTRVTTWDWNQVTSAYEKLILDVTYDELDRATQITRHDPGATMVTTVTRSYDGRGLVTDTADAMGNTSHYAWDALGRLLSVTKDLRAGGTGGGAVTSTIQNTYTYDLGSRITALTDALSKSTTYQYDARDRATTVTSPANGSTSYTYDLNSNVATVTDALGTVTTNTYDNMDQLTSRSVNRASGVLGTTSETFQYDVLGRISSLVDDDSTVQRGYDSLGRTASETTGPNPIGSGGKTFSYGYSAAGALSSITYPDSTVLQYTRDSDERVSSLGIQGGSTLGSYQYSGGRVVGTSFQNSVTKTLSFDALLRPTMVHYQQSSTTIKKFEYLWNPADQRVLEKRHHANGTGDNYDLDSLYRTVKVKAGVADPVAESQNPGSQTVASTTDISMNAVNSRTQVTVSTGGPPTTTNYTTDNLEFYTAVGGTTQVRDANGNLRDDGTSLYDYDYRNQLVRIRRKSDQAVIATYEYDATGRRIGKTTSAGGTSFYWIGLQLAMEYDGSGLVSRRHLGVGFGEVVSAYQRDVADLDGDASTTDYVSIQPLYDGADDCVGVLDHTGALAESYVHSYDGAVSIANGAGQPLTSSAVGWHQGYGRMYRDAESGLLYSVYRNYSPATGRFVTEDPLGRWFDPPGLGSGYAYTANRYRNDSDPLGLFIPPVHQSLASKQAHAWGYNRQFAEWLADADAAVDERQDPAFSYEHGQSSDIWPLEEAQQMGDEYEAELLSEALDAARKAMSAAQEGWWGSVYFRRKDIASALGRIFHMREDAVTHNWCSMSDGHTGKFNFSPEGWWHNIKDVAAWFGNRETDLAFGKDMDVMSRFEQGVEQIAREGGMSPNRLLAIIKTGR